MKSSLNNDKKRRRRRVSAPPLRLAWPTTTAAAAAAVTSTRNDASAASSNGVTDNNNNNNNDNSQDHNDNNAIYKRARPRRVTIQDVANNTNTNTNNNNTNQLWMETHAPRSSQDLCLAPKKVKEISNFLLGNACDGKQRKKLLILVGSPGIGKSTAVRVLARELGFTVHEWNESVYCYQDSNDYDKGQRLDQPTPMASFESFLQQAGAGYASLSLQPTTTSSAATTTTSSSSSSRALILLDTLPHRHGPDRVHAFRQLLTRHVLESSSTIPTVLIYSHVCREGQHRPQQLEELFLDATTTVLYNTDLVQILFIHAPTKARMKRVVQTIVKKEGLKDDNVIVDVDNDDSTGCGGSGGANGVVDFYEDLYARSGGDLRFAISTLQLERPGLLSYETTNSGSKGNGNGQEQPPSKSTAASAACQDQRLTTFHALGKLLYAKRRKVAPVILLNINNNNDNSSSSSNRPPLDFDPERVLEHSDLELSGALHFLEYHSLDFFTDIIELSETLERFSDAAYMLDQPQQGGGGYGRSSRFGGGDDTRDGGVSSSSSAFPEGYASSLASRSVACFNTQPVPGKFRQFSSPKIFEVMRKRTANHDTLRHIHRNNHLLSSSTDTNNNNNNNNNGLMSLSCYLGATSQFATDCLPFVRTILSNIVMNDGGGAAAYSMSSSLDQLHSYIRSTLLEKSQQYQCEASTMTAEETAAILQEQAEILQADDIEEYSSSNSDTENDYNDNDHANDAANDWMMQPPKQHSTIIASAPKQDKASESPVSTVASPSIT